MNQPPLNPDALAHARSAAFDCWENGGNMDDLAECAIEAYLAAVRTLGDGYVCPTLEELSNSEDD